MQPNGQHGPLPPPTDEAAEHYLASVIDALGDTPETVIALQFLREGSCEVLCVGDPADLEGIVIQAFEMPAEPMAFGTSAEAIASLLPHLTGWTCLNVPLDLADALVDPVISAFDASGIRIVDDIYHVLRRGIMAQESATHRYLTLEDRTLVQAAPRGLVGDNVDRVLMTIQEGHVAGAIVDGALVSLASTFATSPRHADIGVGTHPDWRNQGHASAVSALVARAIEEDRRIPVWSCGSTNIASLKTAARVGFEEVSRRVYLIPEVGEDEHSVTPADE